METPALQVYDIFSNQAVNVPKVRSRSDDEGFCEPFELEAVDQAMELFPQALVDDMEQTFAQYQRIRYLQCDSGATGSQASTSSSINRSNVRESETLPAGFNNPMLSSDDSVYRAQILERLYEEFIWLFNLNITAYGIPFDQACLALAIDPEIIRDKVAFEFSKEIREFVTRYSFVQIEDAQRIRQALRSYINFGN